MARGSGTPLSGTTDATRRQADFALLLTMASSCQFISSIWFCWVSAKTHEMNGLWCVMGS
jgi:hypothetical protein